MDDMNERAERFLTLYRTLEGLLDRRYAGTKPESVSVVKEYMRDPDSAPVRTDLDLCREIRNILSHNTDDDGQPVVQPSENIVEKLEAIVEHVRKPEHAVNFGTPLERIMCAHPNEPALHVMRHMLKNGYSHIPVMQLGKLVGVFSAASLTVHAAKYGMDELTDELRIGDMRESITIADERGDRYLFLKDDATIHQVRDAFRKRGERHHRLAVVFLTKDGTRDSELVSMLTPWDALDH